MLARSLTPPIGAAIPTYPLPVFTGLVQAVGKVKSIAPTHAGVRLVIDPGAWDHRPAPGDSICVSGVCLTVAQLLPSPHAGWAFDVIPETLAKTTLGGLSPGHKVNLEHALTPSTLLGGHFVQGHVDGVGEIERIDTDGQWRVTVRPPPGLIAFMGPKGSIAIEGVSLTIASLARATLSVALIPTTLERTTLGVLRPGDSVNIEADILAKMVVQTLQRLTPGHRDPPRPTKRTTKRPASRPRRRDEGSA